MTDAEIRQNSTASTILAPRVRSRALDAARGLATLAMIYVHLVPAEGGTVAIDRAATAIARAIEDKSATLFCLLAGMSWSIQRARLDASSSKLQYALRRAVPLAAVGTLLHIFVWTTEILLPLSLMLLVTFYIMQFKKGAVSIGLIGGVVSTLLVPLLFHRYIASDWYQDGTHEGDHSIGWGTIRMLFIDGNYPVLPWLIFPVVGLLLTTTLTRRVTTIQQIMKLALIASITSASYNQWATGHSWSNVDLATYFVDTWVPTSLPFLVTNLSIGVFLVSLLLWCESHNKLPSLWAPFVQLGRASLTHYVAHICIVYTLLKRLYPEESWSVSTGLTAFTGYLTITLPLSWLWFRKCKRGPIEEVWARISI